MPVDLPGYLWVCDFEGFGFSDCNLGLIMQCVEIFGKHYPARTQPPAPGTRLRTARPARHPTSASPSLTPTPPPPPAPFALRRRP